MTIYLIKARDIFSFLPDVGQTCLHYVYFVQLISSVIPLIMMRMMMMTLNIQKTDCGKLMEKLLHTATTRLYFSRRTKLTLPLNKKSKARACASPLCVG